MAEENGKIFTDHIGSVRRIAGKANLVVAISNTENPPACVSKVFLGRGSTVVDTATTPLRDGDAYSLTDNKGARIKVCAHVNGDHRFYVPLDGCGSPRSCGTPDLTMAFALTAMARTQFSSYTSA